MGHEQLKEKYREYLSGLYIYTLRNVARHIGVYKPTDNPKVALIEKTIAILVGEENPIEKSNRGAPLKEEYLDPAIVSELENIEKNFSIPSPIKEQLTTKNTMEVRGGKETSEEYDKPIYSGILEITENGYGFLRVKNCQPTTGKDIFLSSQTIRNYSLKEGDFVVCRAVSKGDNNSAALSELLSVNGSLKGGYEKRKDFDNYDAGYPQEKILLSQKSDRISLRCLDLFSPIGKGQRALIIAPPKAGKTTLLKDIASSVEKMKEIQLIILLIDERPEEVTDIRSSVSDAEIIYSTFDETAEHHIRAAELIISRAKRLAEMGRDVVILLDSITKLARAYNTCSSYSGKTLSGGLDASALTAPKHFFGAARNLIGSGSITILATALIETGSKMDDVIYEEFKGTGNCDIVLSRELSERHIFPAIDLRRSGTRKEELLLTEKELDAEYKLRSKFLRDNSIEEMLNAFKKTKNNEELIQKIETIGKK